MAGLVLDSGTLAELIAKIKRFIEKEEQAIYDLQNKNAELKKAVADNVIDDIRVKVQKLSDLLTEFNETVVKPNQDMIEAVSKIYDKAHEGY